MKTVFPEATSLKFPPGTLERIREAARQDGTTMSEFMRRAVRSALATVLANGQMDAGQ